MNTPIREEIDGIALRKRDAARRQKEKADNDANYYAVFVFSTQAERDRALDQLGILDKLDDVFLPGSLLGKEAGS